MVTKIGKEWSNIYKNTTTIVSLKEYVDSIKYYKKTKNILFIGVLNLVDSLHIFLSNNDIFEIKKDKFSPTPDEKKPDFSNIKIFDGGNTLSLGLDYEVSVEWILDEGTSIILSNIKKEEKLISEIKQKALKYVEKTGTEYLSDLMVRCYVEGYLESHKNVKKIFNKSIKKRIKND